MADIAEAVRIILEHTAMSSDARRKVRLALGDPDPLAPAPVPEDPRDVELRELRARLAQGDGPIGN